MTRLIIKLIEGQTCRSLESKRMHVRQNMSTRAYTPIRTQTQIHIYVNRIPTNIDYNQRYKY